MENDQREHLARLLEDVKGDPKTSAVLVVMLDAIIQAVAGRCAGCQDCGSTQGAALEADSLTAEKSSAVGQMAEALAADNTASELAEAEAAKAQEGAQ